MERHWRGTGEVLVRLTKSNSCLQGTQNTQNPLNQAFNKFKRFGINLRKMRKKVVGRDRRAPKYGKRVVIIRSFLFGLDLVNILSIRNYFLFTHIKLLLLYKSSGIDIGRIIKRIREDKGLMQKEVSSYLDIGNSNYNKLENGKRDLSVDELQKIAILFSMTTDQILNYENIVPEEITISNKPDFEKLNLINQLDDDDKATVFKIVDTMLTKKKFKDFFNKKITAS